MENDEEIKYASASSNDDNDDDNTPEIAAEDNQVYASANYNTKKAIDKLEALEKGKKDAIQKILSGLEVFKSKQVSDAENASTDASMEKGQGQGDYLKYLLRQTEEFAHFNRVIPALKMTEAQEDEKFYKEEACAGLARCLFARPSCIKVEMKDFQLTGLNWLISLYRNGINGILADEKACNKSLQTISLLGFLHEMYGITGPHMVVAPKSTVEIWMEEIRQICPVLRVVKFLDSSCVSKLGAGEFDVCVTSFESVIKEKLSFRKFSWRYIIMDQVHLIKNENSRLSQTMKFFKTNYRLLIIDTPLQNDVQELRSLLGFLLPEIFSSAEIFGESDQQVVVQQLHKVFRPYLLQRSESDLNNGILKETILKVGMSQMQKQYYRATLQKDNQLIAKALMRKDFVGLSVRIERQRLIGIARQLLKCCNHPYLFAGAEFGSPYTTGEHLIETAGKMVLLDKLLPKLKDSKVILFSQMSRQLDIFEDFLKFRNHNYCRLDGNIGGDEYHASIKALDSPSEKSVFLLYSRAGGLNINLTTADVVILFDSNWYPQADLQQLKLHRIGETKEVRVYRFCTKSTIEEKVIERAYKKLASSTVQQKHLFDLTRINRRDLLQLIRFDVRELCRNMHTTITDASESIDKIIDKGEQKPIELVDDVNDLLGFLKLKEEDKVGFDEICRVEWVRPERVMPPRVRKRPRVQLEEGSTSERNNQSQD